VRLRFAKAIKSSLRNDEYKTSEEWIDKGLIDFKRRILGLCGTQTVKSLDELAKILTELRIVDSVDTGRQFVKDELYGKEVYYGSDVLTKYAKLSFTKIYNRKGQEVCRVDRVRLGYSSE